MTQKGYSLEAILRRYSTCLSVEAYESFSFLRPRTMSPIFWLYELARVEDALMERLGGRMQASKDGLSKKRQVC